MNWRIHVLLWNVKIYDLTCWVLQPPPPRRARGSAPTCAPCVMRSQTLAVDVSEVNVFCFRFQPCARNRNIWTSSKVQPQVLVFLPCALFPPDDPLLYYWNAVFIWGKHLAVIKASSSLSAHVIPPHGSLSQLLPFQHLSLSILELSLCFLPIPRVSPPIHSQQPPLVLPAVFHLLSPAPFSTIGCFALCSHSIMMPLDCIWGVSLFLSLSLGWTKAQQPNYTRWGHSVWGRSPGNEWWSLFLWLCRCL